MTTRHTAAERLMSLSTPVECLCFSKDRPLQLDGYLRSIRRAIRFPIPVTILYKTSVPFFDRGYRQLQEAFPDVTFIPETDFGKQTLDWINRVQAPLILFGCDDVLFHRPVSLVRAIDMFRNEHLLAFSLRLGKNVQYSHSRPAAVPLPNAVILEDVMRWDWRTVEAEWGYPFELDGTLYRTAVIRMLFRLLEEKSRAMGFPGSWHQPNLLEGAGNVFIKMMNIMPLMASFTEACLVVPTVNRVQEVCPNSLQGASLSTDRLEQLRRNDWEMDLNEYCRRTFSKVHIGEFFILEKTTRERASL